MAMNIKNGQVERLATELAGLTGETKTATVLRALQERRERIAREPSGKPRLAQVLDFLEKEVWRNIPKKQIGRGITKSEREKILGYSKGGV